MEEIQFRNPVKQFGHAQIQHIMTLDPKLSDGAYRTFALYLKYAHQKAACWPSRGRMAKERGKTEATLMRHNTELVKLGYITRQRRMNQTWLTIIEDVELIPRLQEMAKAELAGRIINDPSNGSKMIHPMDHKRSVEEESVKKNQGRKDQGQTSTKPKPQAPAVVIYREEANLFPPKSWWPDLEAVTDLVLWRDVVHAYVGLGWNKRNVMKMLGWYDKREIPHLSRGGKDAPSISRRQETPSPETVEAFRAFRARGRQHSDLEGVCTGTGAQE